MKVLSQIERINPVRDDHEVLKRCFSGEAVRDRLR
jgi:hypothetical protein